MKKPLIKIFLLLLALLLVLGVSHFYQTIFSSGSLSNSDNSYQSPPKNDSESVTVATTSLVATIDDSIDLSSEDESTNITNDDQSSATMAETNPFKISEIIPAQIEVSWSIGKVDDRNGIISEDSQSMRLVSNTIYAYKDIKVSFADTNRFKYVRYLFNSDGQYLACENTWSSNSSFVLQKGHFLLLKVREKDYSVWTPEQIQQFSESVSFEYITDPSSNEQHLDDALYTDLIESVKQSSNAGILMNETLTNEDVSEYTKTVASINAITSKNDMAAVICFPTDIHIFKGNTPQETLDKNPILRTMFTRYNKITELVDIDLTIFGGDYLFNGATTKKSQAVNGYLGLRMLIERLSQSAPIAAIKGNHDDNTMYPDYNNGYVGTSLLWDSLLSVDYESTIRDEENIEKGYGYFDITDKKIRVFYLNSADVPTKLNSQENSIQYPAQEIAGFSNEQLNFVAKHLYFNEPDWQVVFFCHHAPSKFIPASNGGKAFIDLLNAFENSEKGSISNKIGVSLKIWT